MSKIKDVSIKFLIGYFEDRIETEKWLLKGVDSENNKTWIESSINTNEKHLAFIKRLDKEL